MVEGDIIWRRGGANVEELPDPLASVHGHRRSSRRPSPGAGDGSSCFYGISALLLVTLLWLIVTAPLSRALEPLADPAMLLVSSEGRPIARRGAIKDAPVDVTQLDPLTPAAFVAIEDRRFYRHWGIDPRAIGRAMVANVAAGGVRQGGSTITQQLAKTSFLSSDRSYKRKAQEVIIAFWLEGWLTKDEILSRYLSSVYFGDGVYGLRAASRHYFGRAPENLSLAQSAMLAGMVQAPSRLAPTRNLKEAQKRSQLVLGAMAETGAISRERAAATIPARAIGSRDRGADRDLFRRLGRARPHPKRSKAISARCASRPRSMPTCSGSPCARSTAPRSAMPRRRWSRCGPTGGSSRWSAGEATRQARSTARPRRGASRDRRSNCSSISPRCAPAIGPTASSPTGRSRSTAGRRPTATASIAATSRCARHSRVRAMRRRCDCPKRSGAATCCAPRAISAFPPRCPTARASRSAPPASACSS